MKQRKIIRKILDSAWVAKLSKKLGFKILKIVRDNNMNIKCNIYIVDKKAPIYIVRGDNNFHTAISLNNTHMSYIAPFNVLAISEYCKEFNEDELKLLRGKDIYFLPKFNGNDLSELESFEKLAVQIREMTDDIIMVHLDKFMEEYNGGFDGDILDLFGAVSQWKGTDTSSFCNSLLYFCDGGSNFGEGGVSQ